MDSFDFDLAKLAQTTIDLSDELPSHNPFESQENYEQAIMRIEDNFSQLEVDEAPRQSQIPNGPGLVYRVDQRVGTFCVRGLPTNSIYQIKKPPKRITLSRLLSDISTCFYC